MSSPFFKRTKIVCTIGPASEKLGTLTQMVRAGMNVARLNFSHGTYAHHRMLIRTIRAASARVGVPVALLADLQGPKVRVGTLPKEGVRFVTGREVVFQVGRETGGSGTIPIPYGGLTHDLKRGDHILLDDGQIEVRVLDIRGTLIRTRVVVGGRLMSHKGFNVPTATLRVPTFTAKDRKDLHFALREGVDFVALSFVRAAADVRVVRRLIDRSKAHRLVQIIVKIEKHEAVRRFDEILRVADGVMIARGDLGIETPAEDVPILQKQMIEKCVRAAKPVIVATQMLDSMIRNPRPTRAEVSDVANAVVDHTDAVMLSGETATGTYPSEAVRMMTKIVQKTEASPYDDIALVKLRDHFRSQREAVSELAALIAGAPGIKLIVVTTMTGATARFVSHLRPELPMVALTSDARVARQLTLSWGVHPMVAPRARALGQLFRSVCHEILKAKFATRGDRVVVVTGDPVGRPGTVNLVKVVKL
ncbi:pyruvate kinase [Candidatus Uhrbacteria bacterium]|nr:pyruvate kinase [Candidatus Uhrbacteria bacterium]